MFTYDLDDVITRMLYLFYIETRNRYSNLEAIASIHKKLKEHWIFCLHFSISMYLWYNDYFKTILYSILSTIVKAVSAYCAELIMSQHIFNISEYNACKNESFNFLHVFHKTICLQNDYLI